MAEVSKPTYALVDCEAFLHMIDKVTPDHLLNPVAQLDAEIATLAAAWHVKDALYVGFRFGGQYGVMWLPTARRFPVEARSIGGCRFVLHDECPRCGSDAHRECSVPLGKYHPTLPPAPPPPVQAVTPFVPTIPPVSAKRWICERGHDVRKDTKPNGCPASLCDASEFYDSDELDELVRQYSGALDAARKSTANAFEAILLVRRNVLAFGHA